MVFTGNDYSISIGECCVSDTDPIYPMPSETISTISVAPMSKLASRCEDWLIKIIRAIIGNQPTDSISSLPIHMKQLLQNLRDGKVTVTEVPVPTPQAGEALVHTAVSLVSVGTERMVVGFGSKSLLGKIRSRPDLVRQVFDKARREGPVTALEAAFNRLDQPMTLGYSSAGTITAVG